MNHPLKIRKSKVTRFAALMLAGYLAFGNVSLFAAEPVSPIGGSPQHEIPIAQVIIAESPEIPSGSIQFDGPLFTAAATPLPAGVKVEAQGYSAVNRPGFPGYVTLKTIEESNFSYRYDLGAAAGATVDVSLLNQQTNMDLSGGFEMRLKRVNDKETDGLQQISVIFIDTNNQQLERRIDLSSAFQQYSFDLTSSSFSSDSVKEIIIRQTYEDVEAVTRQEDRRGEIFVSVDGLSNPGPVNGQAFNEEALSPFPEDKTVSSEGFIRGPGTVPGFITLLNENETAEGTRAFRYDVGGSKAAVVSTEVSAATAPFALDEQFTIAMKNSGNDAKALVRVTDENGLFKEYVLMLSGEFQNFVLDLENDQNDPFDYEHVSKIEIELTRVLSPERRGRIDFYIPMGADEEPEPDLFPTLKPVVSSASVNKVGNSAAVFSALDGAVIYQVQVARDANFNDIVHEGFPSASPETFALNESGDFFVRVRGSKNTEVQTGPVSQWSDAFQLSSDVIFDKQSQVTGAETDSQTEVTTILFDAIDLADLYHVQIATDMNFTNIIHEGFPSANVEGVNLNQNGDYYVRVRGIAKDAQQNEFTSLWTEAFMFNRSVPSPDIFPTLKPVVSNANVDKVGNALAVFSALDGAVIYQVQVARDANFNDIVHEGFPSASPETFALNESGDFFVRVRGSKNTEVQTGPVSQWSDAFQLNSDVIFDKKSQVTGAETDSQTETTTIQFDAIDLADLYHVQIATDINFTNVIHEGFPSANVEGVNLNQNGDYYVRVRGIAKDAGLNEFLGLWSDGFMFNRNVQSRDIFPDANLTTMDISNLPVGEAGFIDKAAIAPQEASLGVFPEFDFGFTFEIPAVNIVFETKDAGFAGGGFTFDNADTGDIETADLSGLQELVFGITNTTFDPNKAISELKFEVVDKQGNKNSVRLKGIEFDHEQFWSIPTSLLTGIDLTQIQFIYFIAEGNDKVGSIRVNRHPDPEEIGPSQTLTAADIVDASDGKIETEEAFIIFGWPSNGVSNAEDIFTQRSASFDITFGDDSYFFAGINFDDDATSGLETHDYSSVFDIRFGLKGTLETVDLIVKDRLGNTSVVKITGITSDAEQVWSIPITAFSTIDMTSIVEILFLAEESNVSKSLEIFIFPPS